MQTKWHITFFSRHAFQRDFTLSKKKKEKYRENLIERINFSFATHFCGEI